MINMFESRSLIEAGLIIEEALRLRDLCGAEKQWPEKADRSSFQQATEASLFQQALPADEAIREPSWRLQGAGAMFAPYRCQSARI